MFCTHYPHKNDPNYFYQSLFLEKGQQQGLRCPVGGEREDELVFSMRQTALEKIPEAA